MVSNDELLQSLGICDGKVFRIKELSGKYICHKSKRVVCEIKGNCKAYVVAGLYENILKGKYTIEQ